MKKNSIIRSLNQKPYYAVVKNFKRNNNELKNDFYNFAKSLGSIVSQNKDKKKIIEIKPDINKIIKLREKKQKIKTVLRYHQTNLGGSIHSDGPQLSSPPKYIIMACEENSLKGGDTILVDTKKIYKHLLYKKKNILNILKKKFYFERRGFNYSGANVFLKPIFEVNKKKFMFRYLRDYIEKGYQIKKKRLSKKQIQAFNYLDKLLKKKEFYKKTKLNRGDLVILNNHTIAHGRTTFKITSKGQQRKLYRIWLN